MPFWAGCGVHITDDEGTTDIRGTDHISGGLVYSHTERTAFCPKCARGRQRSFCWIVMALVLPLAGIAALALLN